MHCEMVVSTVFKLKGPSVVDPGRHQLLSQLDRCTIVEMMTLAMSTLKEFHQPCNWSDQRNSLQRSSSSILALPSWLGVCATENNQFPPESQHHTDSNVVFPPLVGHTTMRHATSQKQNSSDETPAFATHVEYRQRTLLCTRCTFVPGENYNFPHLCTFKWRPVSHQTPSFSHDAHKTKNVVTSVRPSKCYRVSRNPKNRSLKMHARFPFLTMWVSVLVLSLFVLLFSAFVHFRSFAKNICCHHRGLFCESASQDQEGNGTMNVVTAKSHTTDKSRNGKIVNRNTFWGAGCQLGFPHKTLAHENRCEFQRVSFSQLLLIDHSSSHRYIVIHMSPMTHLGTYRSSQVANRGVQR